MREIRGMFHLMLGAGLLQQINIYNGLQGGLKKNMESFLTCKID